MSTEEMKAALSMEVGGPGTHGLDVMQQVNELQLDVEEIFYNSPVGVLYEEVGVSILYRNHPEYMKKHHILCKIYPYEQIRYERSTDLVFLRRSIEMDFRDLFSRAKFNLK